jgi:ribonucleoside-diphosphate reductase alpha chain
MTGLLSVPLGAYIKGTNGKSQGVVPFLKVANDTAVAVNQGGKRKGAVCAYLETWHLDIEEFLELRKNTGDDRRRTHDMNTANWVPDLFMQRVFDDGDWTLFSPSDVPDLHDLYGKEFAQRYNQYEQMALMVKCAYSKKSKPKIYGAKCCRCCLKQVIRGSHLKMCVTYAHHNNTLA